MVTTQIQNNLAQSTSAYLRSAAHQPIHWYEFGDAAFTAAREQDKLILLDIGAVWCHWCHVIDRESYENDEIAQLINADYIAVKVDRDQRPDIDARYQHIVQAMTGQGGWPLTAFLTYDGRVLFGGTYFPPQTMRQLLGQLKDVYKERKDEIMSASLEQTSVQDISESLQASEAEEAQQALPDDVFTPLIENLKRAFDPTHGGFGSQPKFPHFSAINVLLQQIIRGKRDDLKLIVEKSLTGMALGGVYDQIGGGFHRYSVDARWHVPHFEKMAYDNAEALTAYAYGYRMFGHAAYRDVIDGILQFTQTVLSNPEGGFYATQDADINLDDDGDYFTWTLDEVNTLLAPEEAALITTYFDMTHSGDMHERPGRNVLIISKDLRALAQQMNLSLEDAETLLASAKAKMLAARNERPRPFVDTTVYLNWNAMLLCGYFDVADLLDRDDVRQSATKTLDGLLNTHVDAGQNTLLHTTGVPGFLEDYAWFIKALIRGYESTAQEKYREAAINWCETVLAEFEDTQHGGFFDVTAPNETALALLKFRRKPGEDTPSSSPNAVMAQNLISLYWLTGDAKYHAHAEKTLKIFAKGLSTSGLYFCALAQALYSFQNPPVKLEVVGSDASLTQAARRVPSPSKVVLYAAEPDKSEVRLCEGTHCLAPLTTVEGLDAYCPVG